MSLASLRDHPSFQYGILEFFIVDDDIFSFIRKAPYYKSFLVIFYLNLKNFVNFFF
jgi:hypothetical protein